MRLPSCRRCCCGCCDDNVRAFSIHNAIMVWYRNDEKEKKTFFLLRRPTSEWRKSKYRSCITAHRLSRRWSIKEEMKKIDEIKSKSHSVFVCAPHRSMQTFSGAIGPLSFLDFLLFFLFYFVVPRHFLIAFWSLNAIYDFRYQFLIQI